MRTQNIWRSTLRIVVIRTVVIHTPDQCDYTANLISSFNEPCKLPTCVAAQFMRQFGNSWIRVHANGYLVTYTGTVNLYTNFTIECFEILRFDYNSAPAGKIEIE